MVLELLATLSVALVAVCVGLRLAHGSLDFHTALVVLLLAPEAYWPMRRVGCGVPRRGGGRRRVRGASTWPSTTAGSRRRRPHGDAGVVLDDVTLDWGDAPVVTGLTLTSASA